MSTGMELFNKLTERDYSGSEQDTYAQLLRTIRMQCREIDLPELLEKAEAQGKKVVLNVPEQVQNDELYDELDPAWVSLA